jgi:endonuclease/exonuclease/phosphatase family metal-dependent hydrolase
MSWSAKLRKPVILAFFFLIAVLGTIEPIPNVENTIEGRDVVLAAYEGWENAMESGLSIRVMTYNIHHGVGLDEVLNLGRIAADILRSGADIVALQEVDRFNVRSGFQDQVRWLGEKTGMAWSFAPSMSWGFAQYGNAVLSRYPIVSTQVHMLPGTREQRTLMKAVIRIGDVHVNVFNTHLGVGLDERREQVPIAAAVLRAAVGPSILMGDFNMESSHALMRILTENWEQVPIEANAPTVIGGSAIDHIYLNTAAFGAKAWTLPTDASDHDPVVAEWTWGFDLRMALAAWGE